MTRTAPKRVIFDAKVAYTILYLSVCARLRALLFIFLLPVLRYRRNKQRACFSSHFEIVKDNACLFPMTATAKVQRKTGNCIYRVGLITPGHPRIPQDTQGYPRTHLMSYIIHLFTHLFIHSDENKEKLASNLFHF